MFRFESLEIWQLPIRYANSLYIAAKSFPKEEMYPLSDQLKRAAISISNNIAEGSGGGLKNFAKYLNISVMSALETVNILHIEKHQNYITEEQRHELYLEAEKLIRKTRALKNTLI